MMIKKVKLSANPKQLARSLYAPILHHKQQRAARNRELDITFGEQDMLDALSYAGLEENVDCLCIDGTYIRTLYISGYPFMASSDWMDSLINFNHDIDISYHLHEVDARSALPKLNRKITELESTRRAMMREGRIVGSEIIDPLESAIDLRDKIQRGQEKLFQMAIYMAIRSVSKEVR